MINLCDSSKYYTDAILTGAAKRIPKAVEDIEIIGNVIRNETIIFPFLSGLCGINQIASLKINFYNRLLQLEVIGGGANSLINTREPTGIELTKIQESDPLRFNHGWYTINPSFTIGAILTNGNVKLTNLGFNNTRTDCFNLLSDASIIANNVLSLNKISLTNNSRAYDSQFTSNQFLADSSTKMDNMVIEAATGDYTGGSYYNCQLFHSKLFMANAILLNSSLSVNIGEMNTCSIFRSSIDADQSSSLNMISPTISGSDIVANKLYLEGGSSTDSSLEANILYTSDQVHTVKNATIRAELVDNSAFSNSGILSFNETKKISLTNNAQAQINLLYKNTGSTINNLDKSLLNILNSGYLYNGNNDGSIIGNRVDIDTTFINNISGIILTKECNLYNSGINYGRITNCNLYDTSTNASNSGGISIANFYNSSSNNGVVSQGNFYDSSKNTNTGLVQGIFYSGSMNIIDFTSDFIGSLVFRDTSTNRNTIYNATFYNSGLNDGGNCFDTKFYDSSKTTSGSLMNTRFYNSSQQIGEKANASGVNFYDNSIFSKLEISHILGSLHMYDNSSGNNLIINVASGLNCTINDNAIISEIIGSVSDSSEININNKASVTSSNGSLILSFRDQSTCGNSQAIINLYQTSTATGSNYANINCYNNSQISGTSVTISSLVLNDNSQCLVRSTTVTRAELYGQSKFYGNSISSGYIYDNAKLMFSGGFTSDYLSFANGAQNNITINTDIIIFSGNSSNDPSGFITANQATMLQSSNYGILSSITLFKNNSTNYYKRPLSVTSPYYFLDSFNYGSGSNTMHFGSGAINYGYVSNAFFYENSVNIGIVQNGTFHSSITQTGTVLGDGIIDGSLTWSDPF